MKLIFLCVGLLLTTITNAQAPLPSNSSASFVPKTTPGNRYEALVPLSERSATGQAAAMREALYTVLTAVSGLPDTHLEPLAAPIASQAGKLVQHYGAEQDPATRELLFRAAFDPSAVDAALKRQGLPVGGLIAGAEQDWSVQVRGVSSYSDYVRATTNLRKLVGVKSLHLEFADSRQLAVRLRFEGDAASLARLIQQQGQMRADLTAPAGALSFDLVPAL